MDLPDWSGCDVVIVASGPSLSAKQVHQISKARLARHSKLKIVTVNDAIYLLWNADWHHSCDRNWWEQNIERVCQFEGIKTCTERDVPGPWVNGYFEVSGEEGFDPRPGYIRTGRNSGYQALHCAMKTGATRIALCGFDMGRAADGAAHFHDERERQTPAPYHQWAESFFSLAGTAKDSNIEIMNCSIQSSISCFDRVDLMSFLSDT